MIVAETEPVGGFIGESIVPADLPGRPAGDVHGLHLQPGPVARPRRDRAVPAADLPDSAAAADDQPAVEGSRADGAPACPTASANRSPASPRSAATTRSQLERADISDRLGKIYAIRYDIYKRKFFVKFLNNFLAQITPFFFYSVGGYLVIKGSLSLGALVAVLAAYKDILNPWKELLTWYSTKEDVRIKHEQIVVAVRAAGHDRSEAAGRPAGGGADARGRHRGVGAHVQRERHRQPGRAADVPRRARRAGGARRHRLQRQGGARAARRAAQPAHGGTAEHRRRRISPTCTRRCRAGASRTSRRTRTSFPERSRTTCTTG